MHYSLRLMMVAMGLGVLGWWIYLHYRREEERPMAIALLALVVVPIGFLEYRAQHDEGTLSDAATAVAKRDVAVRCQGVLGNLVDIGQELGTVQFNEEGDPADVTHIKRDACQWAKDYARGKRRVSLNAALGVHVIAHEAIHLRGWTNEALTECYGLQHSSEVAQALGASKLQGDRLADFYYRMIYPDMPDEYRSEKCVKDGLWDLHKGTPEFPA